MTSHQGAANKRIPVSAEEIRLINQMMSPRETTRTTLARDLGVSPAWITKTLTPLMERGIIQEMGAASRSGGRRARTLGINPEIGYLLGVDFGATSLDVTLSGPEITRIGRRSLSLVVEEGPESCLRAFIDLADELLAAHQLTPENIRGIGIGVPGPVDFTRGRLISPPIMPGWDNFPLPERVMEHFRRAYVVVDNDVNMMALGALRQGAGHDSKNFIFVKIGSGIGAGIVCGGKVYRGSSGCAGDVGHIIVDREGPLCHCGNYGCVESLAGGMAFARQARALADSGQSPLLAEILEKTPSDLSAIDVGVAAAQGDLTALALIDQNGQYVGEMLTHLVSFFNPDLILIGGGVSKIGHRFLNAIRQVVLRQASPLATRDLRIEYSSLGDQAGMVGALSLAQQYLFCVSDIE
jgi:glucokinase-like ROK family protein